LVKAWLTAKCKQAISCQPVTEKPCLCEAGIMFSAVCSCVSQSMCLSVKKWKAVGSEM